jgi:chaperone modulatory protein CbpM
MTEPVSAHVLDETVELGLAELCSACGVTEQLVIDIVAEGIVEPRGGDPRAWRFTGVAIARIRRVVRLQQEFDVNLPGAALALELFEEIERLRRGLGR